MIKTKQKILTTIQTWAEINHILLLNSTVDFLVNQIYQNPTNIQEVVTQWILNRQLIIGTKEKENLIKTLRE